LGGKGEEGVGKREGVDGGHFSLWRSGGSGDIVGGSGGRSSLEVGDDPDMWVPAVGVKKKKEKEKGGKERVPRVGCFQISSDQFSDQFVLHR
jgi:hypothetical protein